MRVPSPQERPAGPGDRRDFFLYSGLWNSLPSAPLDLPPFSGYSEVGAELLRGPGGLVRPATPSIEEVSY